MPPQYTLAYLMKSPDVLCQAFSEISKRRARCRLASSRRSDGPTSIFQQFAYLGYSNGVQNLEGNRQQCCGFGGSIAWVDRT